MNDGLRRQVEEIIGLPVALKVGDSARHETGKDPENHTYARVFPTEELAVKAYLSSVSEFAQGKAGKLFWRRMPTIEKIDDFERQVRGWQVYSRLVISE